MKNEPLILSIDTALETASVSISKGKALVAYDENDEQRDHAAWIHLAIRKITETHNIFLNDIDAVCLSNGPGSYTGLRVGLSTAKGICYALNKPLITINTLRMIAESVREKATDLICPMIDARRMEVYYAVFDKTMTMIENSSAKILQNNSFSEYYNEHQIVFTGNGCKKFRDLGVDHPNFYFMESKSNCTYLIEPALDAWQKKDFADLAYVEPLYVKEFYTTTKKPFI